MDNQTNTSGGANIDGDVNAGKDFIGRDQHNIQNIIIVGRFLELAQIEGLLPQIGNRENFSNITEAVEKTFGARLDSEWAEATAFAGEILGNFMSKELSKNKPIVLSVLLILLISHIGTKLSETGHWQAFLQTTDSEWDSTEWEGFLWLEATRMFWRRHFGKKPLFGIGKANKKRSGNVLPYRLVEHQPNYHRTVQIIPSGFNPQELRILITGIVLDLIRIHSDNRITVQFLQELADLFKPSPSSTQS